MSDGGFRHPVGFQRRGFAHHDGAVDVSVRRGPYCICGTRIFVVGMFTSFAFSAILVCSADGAIISGFALMIWRISECTTGSARQKAVDLLFGRRKA